MSKKTIEDTKKNEILSEGSVASHAATPKESLSRRDFIEVCAYSLMGVGVASAGYTLVDSFNPSAEVLALSSVEVDISSLQSGQEMKVMWRGKPVIIRRRTKEDIEKAKLVSLSELKDPEEDQKRVKPGKEEFLVMLGICTHLGCVPQGGGKGDFGGWLCPCHGSHYDTSGRIRKGPAPKNMAVPEYAFVSDSVIKIG